MSDIDCGYKRPEGLPKPPLPPGFTEEMTEEDGIMIQRTSAEASKLLRKLNEERAALLAMEKRSRIYVASTNEDAEEMVPEYDYFDTAKALNELDEKIRKVRHAINVFNTTHTVGDSGLMIDEVLITLPQLRERKERLSRMKERLPKTRISPRIGSNVIEYEYANYDIAAVKKDYDDISDSLAKLQLALDKVNTTETMEIDI